MSDHSIKNLVKDGFVFEKKLYKYMVMDFTKLKNLLTGFSYVGWRVLWLKLEHQMGQSSKKFRQVTKTELISFNYVMLKFYPTNHRVLTMQRYNILRKYLTRSYKGKCHLKGKPVRGQRTWSNSKNSKKINNFIRKYIVTKKKVKLDSWY